MTSFDGMQVPPAVAGHLAVAKLSTAIMLTVQQSREQLSTSVACKVMYALYCSSSTHRGKAQNAVGPCINDVQRKPQRFGPLIEIQHPLSILWIQ